MTGATRRGPAGGRRRGFVLVLVLAFLAILAILSAASLKGALLDRERLVLRAREAQAELLAESGRDRARLKLRADPGYAGETWEAPDVGPAGAGRVVIRIEAAGGRADGRKVDVTAEYPAGRPTPLVARRSLSFVFRVGPEESRSRPGAVSQNHTGGGER